VFDSLRMSDNHYKCNRQIRKMSDNSIDGPLYES